MARSTPRLSSTFSKLSSSFIVVLLAVPIRRAKFQVTGGDRSRITAAHDSPAVQQRGAIGDAGDRLVVRDEQDRSPTRLEAANDADDLSSIDRMSIPAVGSSRITRRGLSANTDASSMRLRSPPLSVLSTMRGK